MLAVGLGIVFDRDMPVARFHKPLPEDRDRLVINCAWSPAKVNAPHLATLARIVDAVHAFHAGVGTPPVVLEFRFFTPVRSEFVPDVALAVASLKRDLVLALRGAVYPASVQVMPPPITRPPVRTRTHTLVCACMHACTCAAPAGLSHRRTLSFLHQGDH